MERNVQSLGIQYEHQHMLPSLLGNPSNNLMSAMPRSTTSRVEAWTGIRHIVV